MNSNKVFIIAEAGINHNGDLNIAKQLIEGAKWAGCDAIKFQKRTINKVYTKEQLDKPRESPWGTTTRDQKEGLEFGEKEYNEIDKYCKKMDIIWFASAWDLDSFKFLKKYDLPYNKIASPMLTHKSLVQEIINEKKYTFISTGMSTIEEIASVVARFKGYECPFEIMHCNSAYPMNNEDANLNCISYLRRLFQCKVGYSGHEVGLIPSVAAVALGATSIERHITLNRSMYGTDQSASVEVQGFKRLVDYIREVEVVLGNGIKCVTQCEEEIKKKLRRNSDVE